MGNLRYLGDIIMKATDDIQTRHFTDVRAINRQADLLEAKARLRIAEAKQMNEEDRADIAAALVMLAQHRLEKGMVRSEVIRDVGRLAGICGVKDLFDIAMEPTE